MSPFLGPEGPQFRTVAGFLEKRGHYSFLEQQRSRMTIPTGDTDGIETASVLRTKQKISVLLGPGLKE